MFKRMIEEIVATGLSQAEVARRVGISPPSVVDILSGARKSVRWEVGQALCALHVECTKEPSNV